eukprot:TRINITY_DN21483_c0_g1_i1.p2 TRINITY_DN21483_c0_g1~~TRINITY_DN21483_c0_g1_i1.p2  ORF type:complete len:100 (-),score=4.20 TRINITY_DN21483_c0_g1_i1:151-450(-)
MNKMAKNAKNNKITPYERTAITFPVLSYVLNFRSSSFNSTYSEISFFSSRKISPDSFSIKLFCNDFFGSFYHFSFTFFVFCYSGIEAVFYFTYYIIKFF